MSQSTQLYSDMPFSEVTVQAVTELDNKAAHCHSPVLQRHRPFPGRRLDCQPHHFFHRVVCREHFTLFDRMADHAVCKRLARTVLIFTEKSDQLSRATDRVPDQRVQHCRMFATAVRPANSQFFRPTDTPRKAFSAMLFFF